MKIKELIKILGISMIAISLTSCEDLLEDKPKSEISVENFYKTEADALSAVYSCYEYLGGGAFNENYGGVYFNYYWTIQNLASDEALEVYPNIDWQRLSTFTYSAENQAVYQVWRDAYRVIATANMAVNNIPNIDMDEALKNSLIGEAKFIRGLLYFELVRMFGDIPLMLQAVNSIEEANNVTRVPSAQIYQQIIEDLKAGSEYMPETRLAEFAGRATKYSASAVLGKVYLTLGQWDNAITELNKVINSGKYGLWEDYADVFKIANNNGKESVFSINFSHGEKFWEGGHLVLRLIPAGLGMNTFGFERPTDNLYNSFQDGDRRKDVTFFTSFQKDNELIEFLPHVRKYWDSEEEPYASATYNDLQLYRYADVLLMKAEAINEKSGPNQEAYDAINAIRKRASYNSEDGTHSDVLPDLAGLSKEALRDSILMERKREFAFEGHRWFDLVRTKKLIERVKEAKPEANVAEMHYLFPIPQRIINISTNELAQNPGYN